MTEVVYEDMSVEYVDHMGGDLNVVNSARVSFAKQVEEFDEEKDTKLISYLAKHNHWSPFAHTSITIRCKAPIFVARQMVKHKIGGDWNEESRRYINDTPTFYTPDAWRSKPQNAKQGSGENFVAVDDFWLHRNVENNLKQYNDLLLLGVAPEQARMVLPQSVMTNWMWTGSVAFFARVCKLRLDPHAQKETQELAQKIENVVSPLYPVSWKALKENMVV